MKPHPWENVRAGWGRRKGWAQRLAAGLGLLILPFQPAAAQRLHEIRLEGDPLTGVFRFVPAKVRARAGDVLRFVVQSGGPHAIGFRPAGLGRASREALNGAMPDRLGDLRGPLLISPGTEYRITVPALPAGTYEFFCLTHLAYGMTGALIVGAPPPR